MKKLFYLFIVPLVLLASCKKAETVKPSNDYVVVFTFNPNGIASAITFKNFQTGEVKTYTNRTEDLKFEYTVKPGDRYLMEMKGNTTGLNNLYKISIGTKSRVLITDRALGDASISERILKVDHTFTEADFSNR